MTDPNSINGPGPIILGPDRTHPGMFIIQLRDGTVTTASHADIATIPIAGQWFTGTKTGLLASWPDRASAEQRMRQLGTILGQVAPVTISELRAFLDTYAPTDDDTIEPKLVILVDANGRPLAGA